MSNLKPRTIMAVSALCLAVGAGVWVYHKHKTPKRVFLEYSKTWNGKSVSPTQEDREEDLFVKYFLQTGGRCVITHDGQTADYIVSITENWLYKDPFDRARVVLSITKSNGDVVLSDVITEKQGTAVGSGMWNAIGKTENALCEGSSPAK
jgi:hypothetical protein